MARKQTRREFHRLAGSGLLAGLSGVSAMIPDRLRGQTTETSTGELETFVPACQIYKGPKHHWFGYYDKREFDPTNR